MRRRIWTTLVASVAAPTLLLLPAATAQPSQPSPEVSGTLTGTLADGTRWRADIPADWNGNIFTDLDHVGSSLAPWKAYAVDQGHAYIGIERNTTPYQYQQYISNQVELLDLVTERIGHEPSTVIAVGGSRGGFVARGAIEAYPEVFDGALAMCGGGAGVVTMLNAKLDAVFALKVLAADLVDTSGIELVNITNAPRQMTLLESVVAELRTTAEGRARLALAAAFSQSVDWTRADQEQPDARNYEAQLDNIADSFGFGHPAVVRAGVEAAAGGNPSWNDGVDYDLLYHQSGAQQRVRALYEEAGIDLSADLATLRSAARISADPAALEFAEQNITYSGEIEDPVLTMHTIGDPADPVAFEAAYTDTVRSAGNGNLLRSTFVQRPGHCAFSNAERAAALTTIYERVTSGQWRASATTKSMNALAGEIAASAEGMGGAAFISIPQGQHVLRPWTEADHGTYGR